MTTKKKFNAARLGVLALALTLVTTCLTGGTMARYVTEVTGQATATVADWSFKADSQADVGEQFTTIDLGETFAAAYDGKNIKTDVIAPGTKGSFDIVIDGTGSDVGINYAVKIAANQGTTLPTDLAFKVTNGTEQQADYTLGQDVEGIIDYSTTNDDMKRTVKVDWEWPFDANDTKDSNDNDYASKTWTLDITLTGKQIDPASTTHASI